MNPLLKRKLEHIQQQVDELQGVLQAKHEDVLQQHQEKEDLLQEKWSERKRVTTLDRIAKDYEVLQGENEAYAQERTEIKERLARVMKFTKSLHNASRP